MSDLTVIDRTLAKAPCWVYGWPVDGLGDASVTLRQDGPQGPAKDAIPVLLMIGSAQNGGGLDQLRHLS